MAELRSDRTHRRGARARGGSRAASGALLALLASALPGGGARAADRSPAAGAAGGAAVSGAFSGAFSGASTAAQLLVVFHGCERGRERIEDLFPAEAGYLDWADSHRLIALLPQAAAVPFPNPQGCWDFFAYDDPDHATHEGRQVSAVRRMLDRLRSPELR